LVISGWIKETFGFRCRGKLPDLDIGVDAIVTAEALDWCMAFTHERGDHGPFFATPSRCRRRQRVIRAEFRLPPQSRPFDAPAGALTEARAARVLAGLYERVPRGRNRRADFRPWPPDLDPDELSAPPLAAFARNSAQAQLGTLGSGNPATANQDRLACFESADGVVLVVADGAGGTGGGAMAAEAVVRAVRAAVAEERLNDWLAVLAEVDADLAGAGQSTAVVAELCGSEVIGASVGDSGCCVFGATFLDVTADQWRKPLLGSERAIPVDFRRRSRRATSSFWQVTACSGTRRRRGSKILREQEPRRLLSWIWSGCRTVSFRTTFSSTTRGRSRSRREPTGLVQANGEGIYEGDDLILELD
jgi:hypothetical protein